MSATTTPAASGLANPRRRYWLQRIAVAEAALARGPYLVRDGRAWRFGRRRFSNATVAKLIAAGKAARAGHVVVAVAQTPPAATETP